MALSDGFAKVLSLIEGGKAALELYRKGEVLARISVDATTIRVEIYDEKTLWEVGEVGRCLVFFLGGSSAEGSVDGHDGWGGWSEEDVLDSLSLFLERAKKSFYLYLGGKEVLSVELRPPEAVNGTEPGASGFRGIRVDDDRGQESTIPGSGTLGQGDEAQ